MNSLMPSRSRSGQPRARDLGLGFDGEIGPNNAITDVPGVTVGYRTLIEGDSCRTGLTAILPRGGEGDLRPTRAAIHNFNGNGEMTGSHWIREAGAFTGPIAITNTNGVGAAYEGLQRWMTAHVAPGEVRWFLPVVAETLDGYLNDSRSFYVRTGHVAEAIEHATGGAIEEGNVGGGTGMRCYGFKGGSGTSSRRIADSPWLVGAFVQANFGRRAELQMRGLPIGQLLGDMLAPESPGSGAGSIIVVLATDAPLSAAQLGGIARRATLGIGRTGTCGHHNSGDIFLAFSTCDPDRSAIVPDSQLSAFFDGTVAGVEEAILNALVAARTMIGFEGHEVEAVSHLLITRAVERWQAAFGPSDIPI